MITGGAQGIGRATAMAFAQQGYSVSISDIHKEAGIELVRMIRKEGGQAMFVMADNSKKEHIERWMRVTVEDYGPPDILINNAGIAKNGSMFELALEDWDYVYEVNLRGAFICSQMAARYMKQKQSGAIINIVSTRALMSEADTEAYSASKGGILALTHAMAVSLGRYGIRVNAISPGWIVTDEWKYSAESTTPNLSAKHHRQHPAGRVGKPEDIAEACLYLSDSRSGFITGQNLVIDGGMTIKMIYS